MLKSEDKAGGLFYEIAHSRDGMVCGKYIGETEFSLFERLNHHIYDAKSRENRRLFEGRRLNPNSLDYAIAADPNRWLNFEIRLIKSVNAPRAIRHMIDAEELAKLKTQHKIYPVWKIYNIVASPAKVSSGAPREIQVSVRSVLLVTFGLRRYILSKFANIKAYDRCIRRDNRAGSNKNANLQQYL